MMGKARDYEAAADWAEHTMTLKPKSATALRGDDAAKRGREVLAKALGGRPSIDPAALPGQHARVRQVRVSTEIDARIVALAADRNVKASDIIRDALTSYFDAEVQTPAAAKPKRVSAEAKRVGRDQASAPTKRSAKQPDRRSR
jgi:predicted transcriptional regulator